jgi:hypothetical protein
VLPRGIFVKGEEARRILMQNDLKRDGVWMRGLEQVELKEKRNEFWHDGNLVANTLPNNFNLVEPLGLAG